MGQDPAEVVQMTQALPLLEASKMMKNLERKGLEFTSIVLGKVWRNLFLRNFKSDLVKCYMPR